MTQKYFKYNFLTFIVKYIRNNYQSLVLLIVSAFLLYRLVTVSFIEDKHFLVIAQNFIEGRFHYSEPLQVPLSDIAYYNGKYFPYIGPFPEVLLVPFVMLLGADFSQRWIGLILALFSFLAVFKIARKFSLSPNNSLLVSLFFHFGTVFLYTIVVNITTLQIQSIAASLLVLTLYEFFHKKRWIIIGILLMFSIATRFTLLPAVLFFGLEIILSSEHLRKKIRSFAFFTIPILIGLSLLLFYNVSRFGNPFEAGYTYNQSFSATPNHQAAEKYGLFSLRHVPINLYYFLLKGPEIIASDPSDMTLVPPYLRANNLGMSIIFTSPVFLFIFFANRRKKYVLTSIATCFAVFLPSLLYFGIGNAQFGYRYALDFYPFLLIVLLAAFSKIGVPPFAKILIVYSILFNAYYLYSVWSIYPFK